MEPKRTETDEIQIDWGAVARRLVALRRTLAKAAAIGLAAGILVALSIPRQYTVTVTLSPEMGTDRPSGGLASIASSFLGAGAAAGTDALNASLAPDIVSSTPFVAELLRARVQCLDGRPDTTLAAYMDTQAAPWWGWLLRAPGLALKALKQLSGSDSEAAPTDGPYQPTEEEAARMEALRESVTAEVDDKTGITTLSVTLQDPKAAAVLADSVASKLQQHIIAYRVAKAKDDCAYLARLFRERQEEYYAAQERYAAYVDANKSVVLQSVRAEQERLQNDLSLAYQIYSQVAQQLQLARAKVQEAKPVFAVVEPPTVPLYPSGMSRKAVAAAVMLLAVALTAGWKTVGTGYWQRVKAELASAKGEADPPEGKETNA